jgi:hypothetical protein
MPEKKIAKLNVVVAQLNLAIAQLANGERGQDLKPLLEEAKVRLAEATKSVIGQSAGIGDEHSN